MEELKSFEQIKTLDELTGALNSELNRAAISFVRIGYLLKTARDTDILKDLDAIIKISDTRGIISTVI